MHKYKQSLQMSSQVKCDYQNFANPELRLPPPPNNNNVYFYRDSNIQFKHNIRNSKQPTSQKKFNTKNSNEKKLRSSGISVPVSDGVPFSYKNFGENYYYSYQHSEDDIKTINLQKLQNIITSQITPKLRVDGSANISCEDSLRLYLTNMQQREKQFVLKIGRLERQLRSNVKIINALQNSNKNKQLTTVIHKKIDTINQEDKQQQKNKDILIKQLKEENCLLQRKNQHLQQRKKQMDMKISLLKVKYEKLSTEAIDDYSNQKSSREKKGSFLARNKSNSEYCNNQFQRKKTITSTNAKNSENKSTKTQNLLKKQALDRLSRALQQKEREIYEIRQKQILRCKQYQQQIVYLQQIITKLQQEKMQEKDHYNNLKEECNYFKAQCERLQNQIQQMSVQIKQLQAKDSSKCNSPQLQKIPFSFQDGPNLQGKEQKTKFIKQTFQKMLEQLDVKISNLQKQLNNREQLILYTENVLNFIHGMELDVSMTLREKLDYLYQEKINKNVDKNNRSRRKSEGQNLLENKKIKSLNIPQLQRNDCNGNLDMISQDVNQTDNSPKRTTKQSSQIKLFLS